MSGFGGYPFLFKTDVSAGGVTVPDLELRISVLGWDDWDVDTARRKTVGIDVGVGFDVTHFNPDTSGTVEMDATFFGINVLARLPMNVAPDLPNGQWFPFLGIGGGGHRLAMEAPGTNEGRSTTAFQGLGRNKVFMTKHIAAFTEGKPFYSLPLRIDSSDRES